MTKTYLTVAIPITLGQNLQVKQIEFLIGRYSEFPRTCEYTFFLYSTPCSLKP